MEEAKQKEIQEKYMQIQMIDQQVKQLQKQLEMVEGQVTEIKAVKGWVNEIKDVEVGSDILIPVSNGIFAKAKLMDNKDMLVNVGSSTVVKKSIGDVGKMLEGQADELERLSESIVYEVQKAMAKAQEMEKEIGSITEEGK